MVCVKNAEFYSNFLENKFSFGCISFNINVLENLPKVANGDNYLRCSFLESNQRPP